MLLFVCKANVGRSQIAEGVAKKLGIKAISCAAVEARKEKYNGKPDPQITELLKNTYNIDISDQKINYPNDIKHLLNKVDDVIFFFEPNSTNKIEKEVLIDGLPLREYLEKIGKKINIYYIEDPADKDKNFKKDIIKKIYYFIKNNYGKIKK